MDLDEWIKKIPMRKQIISERTSLFEPNAYIGMYTKIEGNPTLEKLEKAIYTAFSKNGLTMSKIVIENTGNAFYEKQEKTTCKVFVSRNDWKSIIQIQAKQPFDLSNGELVRAFIYEDGGIFFMAHHLVGDGKAILILLEDTLQLLNGNDIQYKPAHILSRDFLESKTKLSFFQKRYIQHINNTWKQQLYLWEDYQRIHRCFWKTSHSKIFFHTFNETETETIKKIANLNKISVNTFLITVLQRIRTDFRRIGIPVDIREDNQSVSNQVSGIEIRLRKYRTQKNMFHKIHQKIKEKIQSENELYKVLLLMSEIKPSLVDAMLLSAYGVITDKTAKRISMDFGYLGKNRRNLGVSNLGCIKSKAENETYNPSQIVFVPPSITYTETVIGVSTFQGKLTIVLNSKNEEEPWFNEFIQQLSNYK